MRNRIVLAVAVLITVIAFIGCAAHDRRAADASLAAVAGLQPQPADSHTALARELEQHVRRLAGDIGVRDREHPAAVRAAAQYIEVAFRSISGRVSVQPYEVDGSTLQNICLEIPGSVNADEIVVVGAHYDTALGTPGADDNASGVAGVIALARRFAPASPRPRRTIRFVAFDTEEPPCIRTPHMGSYHYAQLCRERGEKIVAMLSIEMIGYFRDEQGSQKGPFPSVGNFLLFAGHTGDGRTIKEARRVFSAATTMPSEVVVLAETLAVRARVPLGANSSDQWSFWQFDYPGIMATDTANWRNPHYHQPTDTPDKLSYERMATAVQGLGAVLTTWTERKDADAVPAEPSGLATSPR